MRALAPEIELLGQPDHRSACLLSTSWPQMASRDCFDGVALSLGACMTSGVRRLTAEQ
jgi:hypothetical protein